MGENAFAAVRLAAFRADSEWSFAAAAQAYFRTQPNVALLRTCSLSRRNATYPMVLKLFYVIT